MMRASGAILIEAVVTRDGSVCDARVLHGFLSGNPKLFDEPVRLAVLQWTFQPGMIATERVASLTVVSVRVGG